MAERDYLMTHLQISMGRNLNLKKGNMVKQYLTWKRVKVNDNFYRDPNTDNVFKAITTWAIFHETPFQIPDWRFVSWVEYPDNTPQERIDQVISQNIAFEATFITEIQANLLLRELWVDENNNAYVTVANFVFTDNRPEMVF